MGKLIVAPATSPPPLSEFSDLMARCQRPLYAFLRGIAADDETARDLMQDTFCAAWQLAQRGAPPFDGGVAQQDGVRRWLFHAAYNRAISVVRRHRLISWRSLDPLDTGDPTSNLPAPRFEDQLAEALVMHNALCALAPSDAAILLLIAVQDFTAAEVGQIVGASPQAIAKRFARAKRRLRDAYLAQEPGAHERFAR
jgi:RNA polymerase sigma factor (sigma-70 family)